MVEFATLDLAETGRIIFWAVGILGTLLGFFKLLMEVILKPLNKFKEETKRESEAKSHEPITKELKRLSFEIKDMIEELEWINLNQKSHRKTTILTAKALLSLVSDLSIKGSPNGNTKEDLAKLRDHLYSDEMTGGL